MTTIPHARRALLGVVLSLLLGPIAACSTGSSATTSASTTATADSHSQAAKFADCMRRNGIKDFPDPDASGNLTIDQVANGTSVDTSSAAYKQAGAACKDLQPAGFTGTKRTAEQQAGALEFAQCMRDKGVKDFPDPTPDSPLIDTNRIPSSNSSNGMRILNATMPKCAEFAAKAGVTRP